MPGGAAVGAAVQFRMLAVSLGDATAYLGAAGFVIFAAFGAIVLRYDTPLRWTGRVVQKVINWVRRKGTPVTGLDATLVAQRDEIRTTLGQDQGRAGPASGGAQRGQPLAAGPIAYGLFRLRYRHHSSPP